jgi:hypothetical protein
MLKWLGPAATTKEENKKKNKIQNKQGPQMSTHNGWINTIGSSERDDQQAAALHSRHGPGESSETLEGISKAHSLTGTQRTRMITRENNTSKKTRKTSRQNKSKLYFKAM